MSKYELTLMSKSEKLLTWMAEMGARVYIRTVHRDGEDREVVTVEAVVKDDMNSLSLSGRLVSVNLWWRGGNLHTHCFEALWDYIVADGLDKAEPYAREPGEVVSA